MTRFLIAGLIMTLASAPVLWAQQGQGEHGNMDMGGMGMHQNATEEHHGEMEGHAHAKSQLHSGMATMTKAHHFEVVSVPDGIRVYAYNAQQKPASTKGMEGRVTIMYKQGEPKVVTMTYHEGAMMGDGDHKMPLMDYMMAPVDLSGTSRTPVQMQFKLSKVAGEEGDSVEFTEPYEGVVNAPYTCPMHPNVWGKTAKSECPLCGMYTSAKRMAGVTRSVHGRLPQRRCACASPATEPGTAAAL